MHLYQVPSVCIAILRAYSYKVRICTLCASVIIYVEKHPIPIHYALHLTVNGRTAKRTARRAHVATQAGAGYMKPLHFTKAGLSD